MSFRTEQILIVLASDIVYNDLTDPISIKSAFYLGGTKSVKTLSLFQIESFQ